MLLEITLINDEVLEEIEEVLGQGLYIYQASDVILMWEQDYFAADWLHSYVDSVVNFVNEPIGSYRGV